MPDAKVIEQVLSALDNGIEPRAEVIARVVSATLADVREALAALASYRDRVRAERATPVGDTVEGRLAAGTRLGDFVLAGELGSGAMGVVYRATQAGLDRQVAIKVLSKHLVDRDPRFVARFRREAALAASIRHPHVAEVFGFFEEGETLGFAMRLVDGRTLHEELRTMAAAHVRPERPTSVDHVHQAVRMVRALADALAVIHARGLVHRDVKPANVILERGTGEGLAAAPVLVDFGLLRPTGESSLTGTHTLLGTPSYAAHESVLGQDVDARADVFSLGATLHDVLTLTSPGTRGPATAGLPEVRAVNPCVDARLSAIVGMALQSDKTQRYEHGGAFRDELDRYLRGETIRALPASPWGRLVCWVRRDRIRAMRVGAFAAVVFLVAIAILWATDRIWSMSSLASAAARFEQGGDVAAASTEYERLRASTGVSLLPWLADAMHRAALYGDDAQPMARAVAHLRAGARLLAVGDDGRGEGEFALAADRMCEILCDSRHVLREAAVAYLMRETRDGQRAALELRRRVAMDAWTNYLILQDDRQDVPEGLHEVLRRAALEPDGTRDLETRVAAVAALAAIRSKDAFMDLVDLLRPGQSPEVVECALRTMLNLHDWLFAGKTAPGDSTEALFAQWARGVQSAEDLPGPHYQNEAASRLAQWERSHGRRLEVSPPLRMLMEQWHRDPDAPTYPPQRFSGDIWKHRPDEDSIRSLCARPRDAASAQPPSRLDFTRSSASAKGVTRVRLSGTLFDARCRAGVLCEDGNASPGYLFFDRPGHSQLRVRSIVPEGATGLTARIRHMPSTRAVLRNHGTVVVRLQVVAARPGQAFVNRPWECSTLVNRPWPDRDPETRADVPLDVFQGYPDCEIVCDFVRGDTTYRVLSLELEWRFEPEGR